MVCVQSADDGFTENRCISGCCTFHPICRQHELLVERKCFPMAQGLATASQIGSTVAHGSSAGSSLVQASALHALQLLQELKKLKEEPVGGFLVRTPDEGNMFEWEVALFGSPGSLYEGGYFKARCCNRQIS